MWGGDVGCSENRWPGGGETGGGYIPAEVSLAGF